MNVIIYLYGNTDTVALSDTEAAGKHYLIVDIIFLHGFFKKLYNIFGALEVARRADTNLNEQHILYLCQNFFSEEISYVFGSNGVEGVIYRYTYAFLTFTHAEGAAKLNLITEIILSYYILKLLLPDENP